jgi:hypothetical protein
MKPGIGEIVLKKTFSFCNQIQGVPFKNLNLMSFPVKPTCQISFFYLKKNEKIIGGNHPCETPGILYKGKVKTPGIIQG